MNYTRELILLHVFLMLSGLFSPMTILADSNNPPAGPDPLFDGAPDRSPEPPSPFHLSQDGNPSSPVRAPQVARTGQHGGERLRTGPLQPSDPKNSPSTIEPQAVAQGRGLLMAGASAKIITPRDENGNLWMEPFEDRNKNGRYDPPNEQYPDVYYDPFTDINGNGKWDGPWFAGYEPLNRFNFIRNSSYYYAQGVHDDLWTRAIVLKVGDSKIAFVSLDVMGLMNEDIKKIKQGVQDLRFDNIIVGATHNHAGLDTVGIFGPKHFRFWNLACALMFGCRLDIRGKDGKDPRFMDYIRTQSIEALREADAGLREAQSSFVHALPTEKFGYAVEEVRTRSPILNGAYRDPLVIDKDIWAMRLTDMEDRTIGTLVNWTPHPNSLGTRINTISSDFPHYLREAIEKGNFIVDGKHYEGIGGVTVYFSGAIGGHLGPGEHIQDESGMEISASSYLHIQRIGQIAAAAVLDGLANAPIEPIHGLFSAVQEFTVPMKNEIFGLALRHNLIQRKIYGEAGAPTLKTEVDFVALEGPHDPVAQFITVPGELFPEIAIGGYLKDMGKCWEYKERTAEMGWKGRERSLSSHPNIPGEPVIKDHMQAPYKFLLGLTQDYLGYIVPANDFVAPAVAPILFGKDNCGSRQHYHETLSIGPDLAPLVAGAAVKLTQSYDAWREQHR